MANAIRPLTPEARHDARNLMRNAHFAALGVLLEGAPFVTRIALASTPEGLPMTAISDLSHHTKALKVDPRCSLLVGEPGEKGDPLTFPRLTLQASAKFLDRKGETGQKMRDNYVACRPKAKLYIDFSDFQLVTFQIERGFLNAGFGSAFDLTAEDLVG